MRNEMNHFVTNLQAGEPCPALRTACAPPAAGCPPRRPGSAHPKKTQPGPAAQYYVMFEVLESTWATFQTDLQAAGDLAGVIAAHEKYLNSILQKVKPLRLSARLSAPVR